MKEKNRNTLILIVVAGIMLMVNITPFLTGQVRFWNPTGIPPANDGNTLPFIPPEPPAIDPDHPLFYWNTAEQIPGSLLLMEIFNPSSPSGWGNMRGYPEKPAGYTGYIIYTVSFDLAFVESKIGMTLEVGQGPGLGQLPDSYQTVIDHAGDFLANDAWAVLGDGSRVPMFELYHFY